MGRKSIYLSDRRDTDILNYVKNAGIGEMDFSFFMRGLIRDGIRFRSMGKAVDVEKVRVPLVEERAAVSTVAPDFSDVELEKAVLSDDQLNARFKNL